MRSASPGVRGAVRGRGLRSGVVPARRARRGGRVRRHAGRDQRAHGRGGPARAVPRRLRHEGPGLALPRGDRGRRRGRAPPHRGSQRRGAPLDGRVSSHL